MAWADSNAVFHPIHPVSERDAVRESGRFQGERKRFFRTESKRRTEESPCTSVRRKVREYVGTSTPEQIARIGDSFHIVLYPFQMEMRETRLPFTGWRPYRRQIAIAILCGLGIGTDERYVRWAALVWEFFSPSTGRSRVNLASRLPLDAAPSADELRSRCFIGDRYTTRAVWPCGSSTKQTRRR